MLKGVNGPAKYKVRTMRPKGASYSPIQFKNLRLSTSQHVSEKTFLEK
jgi:hypothetical protein